MKFTTLITSTTLSLGILAGSAFAQDPISNAIGARQSLMRLYAFNIGTLGGMAKGAIAYDAAAATTAEANIAKLASIDGRAMFPTGSDDKAAANTAAKPEIWSNMADVGAKFGDLVKASIAMEAAAGGGLDAMKGAIGALGGACGACHKAYRTPKS